MGADQDHFKGGGSLSPNYLGVIRQLLKLAIRDKRIA
jgi:hypothetical protein